MCLIFLSLNEHPRYKFILAGNRDEFHDRPTAPAQFWRDHPNVLGGRDLEANGTWLGMTRGGKIGMLTNYRDPRNINPNAPSRGKLVSNYLEDRSSPSDYLYSVMQEGRHYNGFNLLVGTVDELYYYSNYKEGFRHLNAGFFGISNHLLDTPWPKVTRGKERMKELLVRPTVEVEKLFEVLADDRVAGDADLPDTGLSLDRERALSAMFIKTPNYGSRCSTIILVSRTNEVMFAERTFDLRTYQFTTQSYQFMIQSS